MKLLLDENLSPKLPALLGDAFRDVSHVREHGLVETADTAIWSFAAAHGMAIVTKDADFAVLSETRGHPPKVVLIDLGNVTTAEIARVLVATADVIRAALDDDEQSLVIVG